MNILNGICSKIPRWQSSLFMVVRLLSYLSGVLFVLGLFTRIACIILICTLGYIAFFVGHGKIWYEDQYPFLFVVIGFIFFFTGPGSFSLDSVIFKNKND